MGYPALAEFLSSDERWSIYRRFKYLQTRLVLEKQDDLRLIEEELKNMDAVDRDPAMRDAASMSKWSTRQRRDADEAAQRRVFFDRAERMYKEYAELLLASTQIMHLENPSPHECKGVDNFISDTKPIVRQEAGWIHERGDLVTLRGARQHATLDAYLEEILLRGNHYLNRPTTLKSWLAVNARAEKLANVIISTILATLIPAILILPIYALATIGRNIGPGIVVLVLSALVFTVILAIGTTARSHEIWSSVAA